MIFHNEKEKTLDQTNCHHQWFESSHQHDIISIQIFTSFKDIGLIWHFQCNLNNQHETALLSIEIHWRNRSFLSNHFVLYASRCQRLRMCVCVCVYLWTVVDWHFINSIISFSFFFVFSLHTRSTVRNVNNFISICCCMQIILGEEKKNFNYVNKCKWSVAKDKKPKKSNSIYNKLIFNLCRSDWFWLGVR